MPDSYKLLGRIVERIGLYRVTAGNDVLLLDRPTVL